MGAWGVSPLESDEGQDWLLTLREEPNVIRVFKRWLKPDVEVGELRGYHDGMVVLCIAEVLAARLGAPRRGVPQLLDPYDGRLEQRLAKLKPALLARLYLLRQPAIQAIERWKWRTFSDRPWHTVVAYFAALARSRARSYEKAPNRAPRWV